VRIKAATVRHLEVPIDREVVTAFGVMRSRHAVFLVVEDDAGNRGVGESWVNFPHWAPWERVAAFEHAFIPYLEGKEIADVAEFVDTMYAAFRGPAVQSGTVGTLLQATCAVELALWDLAAKREEKPLSRLLFDDPADRVRVYASGINSPIPFDLVDEHLACGVDIFKLKLGFGDDKDRTNLEALVKHLDGRAGVAVDVNRGWTRVKALEWLDVLADYDVQWLEEPLHAEEEASLVELYEADKVPIAMGENVLLEPTSDASTLADLPGHVIQPDLTKYAPLHVVDRRLSEVAATGKRLVPHFLGSAPGQAASLQFASGCPAALVELDINPNPLRTDLMTEPFEITDGCIRVPDAPGIGWTLREEGA